MAKSEEFDDLEYGMASPGDFAHYDDDDDINAEVVDQVPNPSMDNNQMDADNDEALPYNPKVVARNLRDACKEMGIQCDEEMTNVVLSGTSVYEWSTDSLRWFVLGITYMNNKRIVPNFTSMLGDLKAEIKSLQQTNNQLKSSATDINKKMLSVKDEIIEGFDKLRAGVLDKVIQIAETSRNTAPSFSTSDEPLVKDKGKGVIIIDDHENTNTKTLIKMDSKPTIVKTENPLIADKVRILIKEGGIPKEIKALTQEDLDLFLSDSEYVELLYGSDASIIQSIKDDVLLRLAESDMLSF
ncbi:TPA_asm: P [Wurfbainia alphacytorhabdovirus 1]|nr:TPA_asm: P [Wurfbainia alphacytorhabdovirus 1]